MAEKPYIERRHVELEEESEYTYGTGETVTTTWCARVYGILTPTKEQVQMSRTGSTAKLALEALREAVGEQGWELR